MSDHFLSSSLPGVRRGLPFRIANRTYTLLERAAITKSDEFLVVPDSQARFLIETFLRQDETDGLWRYRMREVWELLGLAIPMLFPDITNRDLRQSFERSLSDALLINRFVLLEDRLTGLDKSGKSGRTAGQQNDQAGGNQNNNREAANRKKSSSADSDDGPRKGPKKTFVAIVLRDDSGKPVPGEKYKVTAPDGSVHEGTLDENGGAYIDDLDPGNCQVQFPDLDAREWRAA